MLLPKTETNWTKAFPTTTTITNKKKIIYKTENETLNGTVRNWNENLKYLHTDLHIHMNMYIHYICTYIWVYVCVCIFRNFKQFLLF